MPRSLISCYENIVRFLDAIAKAYGRQGRGAASRPQRHGAAQNATMKEIFQGGLHEFITAFLEDNTRLGPTIGEQYLLG